MTDGPTTQARPVPPSGVESGPRPPANDSRSPRAALAHAAHIRGRAWGWGGVGVVLGGVRWGWVWRGLGRGLGKGGGGGLQLRGTWH